MIWFVQPMSNRTYRNRFPTLPGRKSPCPCSMPCGFELAAEPPAGLAPMYVRCPSDRGPESLIARRAEIRNGDFMRVSVTIPDQRTAPRPVHNRPGRASGRFQACRARARRFDGAPCGQFRRRRIASSRMPCSSPPRCSRRILPIVLSVTVKSTPRTSSGSSQSSTN